MRGKDGEFYCNLAYAIAFGWGKIVQQSGRGVKLAAFQENLQRGERGLSRQKVHEVLDFGKSIGLFHVERHAGAQSVVLHRTACSESLGRFIYEIHEMRRPGGATGTAGNTSAPRSDSKKFERKRR